MIAKRIFFSGRVQGVGFRFGTKQIAMGYEVVGAIRNLNDGRVELYLMGDSTEVEEFLSELRERSNLAHHILDYVEEEIPCSDMESFNGFSIIR